MLSSSFCRLLLSQSNKSPSPPEPEARNDDKAPILKAQDPQQAHASHVARSGPPGIAPAVQEIENVEWYYKDPSGNEQGPFPASDMCEWHSLGYFKEDLLVRRSFDQDFFSLGTVIARYGTDPFRAKKHPPSLKAKEAPVPAQPAAPPQQVAATPQQAPAPAAQQAASMAQPGLQPLNPPQQDPIHDVIYLIRTQEQYATTFRQLMYQIQNLGQYKVFLNINSLAHSLL